MLKKTYQTAFLSFFILFLSLPIIKHIVGEDKINSSENRLLTQKPNFPKNIRETKTFINTVDDYLSDQFGFRRNFISGSNKVRYKLFNEIASKQITVGENGFIYFNSHGAENPNSLIKAVCNVNSLPKDFQQKTVQYFSQLMNHSKILGINIDVAIIPTKARVYPENLPKTEKEWCTLNPPAWWENMFKDSNEYRIYYPLNKMMQLKKPYQYIYPNTFIGMVSYLIS